MKEFGKPEVLSLLRRIRGFRRLEYHAGRTWQKWNVQRNTRHIHGATKLELDSSDVVVVCLVKDGELFIRSFLDHYRRMGVKHVVFMDNGSTDSTIEIASQYDWVSIIQCTLPAFSYEMPLRRHALERFAKGHWCLCLDIDEIFDYPYSSRIPLSALLSYLGECGYTAVVAQMLDMFAPGPLNSVACSPTDRLLDVYRYYDVSDVEKVDYFDQEVSALYSHNTISNPDIKVYYGGIRKQLFGTRNGLTKHCLFRMVDGLQPMVHPHYLDHGRIADFTAVLYHFKFAGDFYAMCKRHVDEKTWPHAEYEAYLKKLEADGELTPMGPTARKLERPEQLLDDHFLMAGERFKKWAEAYIT